jgi:ribosomal protein L16/L10AE
MHFSDVSGGEGHIWRVDRTGSGWGTPQHLSAAVNIGPRIFAPSIDNGNTNVWYIPMPPRAPA